MTKKFEPGAAPPPQGRCRTCGVKLVRDTEVRRPRWDCPNVMCRSKVKPGRFIGPTRIV